MKHEDLQKFEGKTISEVVVHSTSESGFGRVARVDLVFSDKSRLDISAYFYNEKREARFKSDQIWPTLLLHDGEKELMR